MENFTLYNAKINEKIVNKRKGEAKFGEAIQIPNVLLDVKDNVIETKAQFILFGIEESIGVFLNYGKTGTEHTWKPVLKNLLNTQCNQFNQADNVMVLGSFNYKFLQNEINILKKTTTKNIKKARGFIDQVDADVAYLVNIIVKAGKVPIAIGGGHNNSYGMIKGCALAFNKKINVINLDAHSDFRPEEGRHSGNGFSYAFAEGFLKRYFIFGLHENYTSEQLINRLKKIKNVNYNTFEDLEIRKTKSFKSEINTAVEFISHSKYGIEIDCDAIAGIPSSAGTSTGFSSNKARQFLHVVSKPNKVCYLHICEAIVTKKDHTKTAKFISYLITDFLRNF